MSSRPAKAREDVTAERNASDEISALRAERDELIRRLTLRTEELEVATRRLGSIDSAVELLQHALGELREELGQMRREREELVRRVDTLALHNDGLARALATTETERDAARAQLGRLRDVEVALAELEGDRVRTIEDLRRVANSRAWRWGHGITRLMRAATFRPTQRTAGGVEAVLARLDSRSAPPPPAEQNKQLEA